MKKIVSFMLLLVLILPLSIGFELKAAEKPSLSWSDMTIGIGSYGCNEGGYYSKDETKYELYVEDSNKNATYTFTSSDKKIATVKKDKKDGTKAYITGVKAGKTTITVKQKLKGKTTTVGKCKITVKNATLKTSKQELKNFQVGDYYLNGSAVWIENFNPEAKYTFSSNKKGIKFSDGSREIPDFIEGMFYQDIKCSATKTGTYKITVKETYNKKTRTLGTFSVTVVAPTASKKATIYVGETVYISNRLLSNADSLYYFANNDKYEDIIELGLNEGEGLYVKGLKAGTAVLNYYYDDNGKEGKKIGSTTITVKPVEILDIDVQSTIEVTLDDYNSWIDYSIETNPTEACYYINAQPTITSSDKSIVDISSIESECFKFEAKKAGTAVITITIENVSKTIQVTIK